MEKNFTILVPYRNRLEHLQEFTLRMLNFLGNCAPKILVIEQADNHPFNRGALLNIGFLRALKSDWVVFHDVDMLPLDSSCNYSKPLGVCHLAARVEQFNFCLPYNTYLGGVLLATNASFSSVNGFSNQYWGWGDEDDDLFVRFWRKTIEVERRPGLYRSLPHPPSTRDGKSGNHELFYTMLQRSASHPFEKSINPRIFRRSIHGAFDPRPGADTLSQSDGLSTVEYELISQQSLRSYAQLGNTVSLVHQVIAVKLHNPLVPTHCVE